MVLVESAWKGNRLVWGRYGMAAEYAVLALGVLRERRATPVLIDYLQRHLMLVTGEGAPPHTVKFACAALGSIGDPAAVPVLLIACSSEPRRCLGVDAEVGVAGLERCVSRGTLGLVRTVAHYLTNPPVQRQLKALVEKKQAEFAAKGKAGGARKN